MRELRRQSHEPQGGWSIDLKLIGSLFVYAGREFNLNDRKIIFFDDSLPLVPSHLALGKKVKAIVAGVYEVYGGIL